MAIENHHPHSRFSLHENADLFPFRDLIWQRSDGPFIDLKVDFPDPRNNYADGTAYLRVEDVVEMAHCLGMATLDEVKAYKKRIAELEAQVNAIPTIVEEYKNGLAELSSDFLDNLSRQRTLAVADESEPEVTIESSGEDKRSESEQKSDSDKKSGRNNSGSSGTNGKAEQSSDDSPVRKGPNDVSGADRYAALDLTGILGPVS